MHETLWKCKCDVIHEHLRSFKQNPTQKFHRNFINFEKPQKFSKTPKVRSKEMKDMINVRGKVILEEENTLEAEDWVGKMKSVIEKCLGEGETLICWERLDKMREKKSHWAIYRKHEAQWIKRYLEVSSFNFHQMELSRSYQEVSIAKWPRWIEKLSSIQKLSQWIENL